MPPHETPKQGIGRVPAGEQIVQQTADRDLARPRLRYLCSTHHIQT
jgi:hypothetical protein